MNTFKPGLWRRRANGRPASILRIAMAIAAMVLVTPPLRGAGRKPIRIGTGLSIVSTEKNQPSVTAAVRSLPSYPYPRPRLAGFSPLVAIATSDEGKPLGADLEFEHKLESTYVGSSLIPGTTPDVVIGVLDSGSDTDLAAGSSADVLGLYYPNTVGTYVPIGGVGDDTILAEITMPVGWFAQGLAAVQGPGQIDFASMVGHSNVCGLASPPIVCDNGEGLRAVMGMSFLAFYNSIIRVDTPRHVEVRGETYSGPDVTIQDPLDELPMFSRFVPMAFGGLSVAATTANYYPSFDDLETPIFPTLLSLFPGSIPFGGNYFATVTLLQIDPDDPFNIPIPVDMLVDTGAQSSIISSRVAGLLSLPLDPDFTVSICGVGGLVNDVPGYYIDAVQINALGGALNYSRAPFIVADLPASDGTTLDGVLGMNFFWNRNVIFQPDLQGVAFLHVSEPVPFAYGDYDADRDVDDTDADWFSYCATDPIFDSVLPECDHMDSDGDFDVDLADYARFQRCYSGENVFADTACAP